MKWISMDSGKPEKGQEILAYFDGERILVDKFGLLLPLSHIFGELTHWMLMLSPTIDTTWVSISKQKPEETQLVLAYYLSGTYRITPYWHLQGQEKFLYTTLYGPVTHWKPLVTPYGEAYK